MDCIKCRMVGETVTRSTFMSMATCDNLDTAMLHAINNVKLNSLHLSLVPVLVERYIKRLIQLEPLLGMATVAMRLKVPVVSMYSIMQLFNGRQVTNREDREAMREFVQDAVDEGRMVRYLGMDGGYSTSGTSLPGYVTCPSLSTYGRFLQGDGPGGDANSNGSAGARGGQGNNKGAAQGGGVYSVLPGSKHGIPMEPLKSIFEKIYTEDQKVLASSAFLQVRSLEQQRAFFMWD